MLIICHLLRLQAREEIQSSGATVRLMLDLMIEHKDALRAKPFQFLSTAQRAQKIGYLGLKMLDPDMGCAILADDWTKQVQELREMTQSAAGMSPAE